MSKVRYGQSGYIGSSMSVRAKRAYESGEKPLSKFRKSDVEALESFINELLPYEVKLKMTVKQLKNLLEWHGHSSWHHTGKFANATDFYSIAYALTNGFETDLELVDVCEDIDFFNLDVIEEIMNYAEGVQ